MVTMFRCAEKLSTDNSAPPAITAWAVDPMGDFGGPHREAKVFVRRSVRGPTGAA